MRPSLLRASRAVTDTTMMNQTESRWPGHVRAFALVCWSLAVMMTAALGWSAWQAYDNADEVSRHVQARMTQELGVAPKPVGTVARQ